MNEGTSSPTPAEPADTGTETRSLTLDEAIQLAKQLQQQGQLDAAQSIYDRVLQAVPELPVALHFSGVLAHQQGRREEALARIERSLVLVPNDAAYQCNYGLVLQENGRLDEAVAAYQRALELDPNHVNAYSNVGVVLRALNRLEDAEAAYRKAIEIDPKHVEAHTNMGVLLNAQGRLQEAVAHYYQALTLNPKHKNARLLLGLAHGAIGEVDKAAEIFEEWLREEPDNPVAQHMLAACRGSATTTRASDEYVKLTFDRFSATFESKLARLGYRAPNLVEIMIETSGIPKDGALEVLDAGCGTGLCGPLLAPYAKHLVGVDLSSGMLTHADSKGVYQELYQVELTAYLRDQPGRFDLIVSADTLCYFGTLDEVVPAAAGALRPGGHFVFTVERAMSADVTDYHLQLHGRYTHAQPYVERLLREAGLEPLVEHADLRMENGVPVAGLVVRATKPERGTT